MYYKNLISQYGAANVLKDGKIWGIRLEINFPNMFGTSLAFYNNIEASIDKKALDGSTAQISVDNHCFYPLEGTLLYENVWWDFAKRAVIRIEMPGGATPGCHEVEIKLYARGADGPAGVSSGHRILTFV